MNKGFTNKDAYEQIGKLVDSRIEYDALLMLGVAGKDAGLQNTDATIELLSTLKLIKEYAAQIGQKIDFAKNS